MNSIQNVQSPTGNAHPEIGILQQKLPDRLAEVLRRALVATGGNGAAIALMRKNIMVTCARAGYAPDLGSQVNMDSSFAGLCVRTGKTLRSDHLETDPRVNGAAWRALNVSSMVVTPVRHGDAIVGVLAVFAEKPHAFLPSHCVALEILALVLDTTPPKRPPPNHYPTPMQFQRTSLKESAVESPAAPHEPSKSPTTASICLPVAAGPPEPSAIAPSMPSAAADKNVETPYILRFRKSERMLHWSIAIPFLVCFASALILVIFYNPHPQRAYRLVFSLLHRMSGACLLVMPAVTALRNRSDHRIHFHNIKEAFTWMADDVKWLFLMGAATLSSKVSLPEQGKFNAAEKLNFIMVLCTYPLFIASGLILWRLHVAFAAWMLHVGMAAVAAPLVLGHIFMATINPETRVGLSGMLTGYVDRHWAKHHYTRWYRQQFEDGHARGNHHGEMQARRQSPVVQCPSEAKS